MHPGKAARNLIFHVLWLMEFRFDVNLIQTAPAARVTVQHDNGKMAVAHSVPGIHPIKRALGTCTPSGFVTQER